MAVEGESTHAEDELAEAEDELAEAEDEARGADEESESDEEARVVHNAGGDTSTCPGPRPAAATSC